MPTRNSVIIWVTALLATVVAGVLITLERGAHGSREVAQSQSAGASAVLATSQAHGVSVGAQSAHDSRDPVLVVDASTAQGDGLDLVDVDIVSADKRVPLANASVWWWPRRTLFDGGDGFEGWLRRGEVENHHSEAVPLRANEAGRVRVPSSPLGFHVVASSNDLWGAASFGTEREQHAVVALAPDLDLRVGVVDPDGAPVFGVPVALRQQRLPLTFDVRTSRTEAPDGIAVLRHTGRGVAFDSASATEFVLALPGLFDPPIETRLERGLASKEPVILTLPPTGSCAVVVVDANDRPVSGPMDARLRFADAGNEGVIPPWVENIVSRSAESIVYEHVTLGHVLAVEVLLEGSNAKLEGRGLGPQNVGERVSLRVPIGANVAILRGRLVDASGTPIAGATARAQLESSAASVLFDAAWSVRTQADGVFSFDTTPIGDVPDGAVLALHRTAQDGSEIAVGRRRLPHELAAGSHELGDFVLVDTPMAVAGIVVDSDGHPVAGAAVIATVALPATPESAGAALHESLLSPVRSDARGAFGIRGEAGSGKLSVVAQKAGLVGDPVIADPGERSVRLVLRAAAAIEGTVLLDPSFQQAMVLVEAVREDVVPSPTPMPSGKSAVLGTDGRFAIDGLRGAHYSIRVVHAATGSLLGSVAELVVRPGETTRDPRTDPLDLVAHYRILDLELIDERGQLVHDARAFSRPSGDPDAKWIFAAREAGHVRLLTDGRPLDVAISATGYLRTELVGIRASQRIALRAAARLRLRLADGVRVLQPPLYLGVELIPLETGRLSASPQTSVAYFDEHGELTCQTAYAGDLRADLVVLRRDSGSALMEYVRGEASGVLHVADQAGEQTFEIRCDPARIEAAVRATQGER